MFPGDCPGSYPSGALVGSWFALKETMELFQSRSYRQPTYLSCPRDGVQLTPGPDGVLRCRFDGYQPGQVNDPGYGVVTS